MNLNYFSESGEIAYNSEGAAGLDLPFFDVDREEIILGHNESMMIKTGIYVEIPIGHVGLLDTRSSTGKAKVDLLCRTIDPDFRGNIRLMVINHNEYPVCIKRGDLVAQILILPCPQLSLNRVNSIEDLTTTVRAGGSFGSTGRTITVITRD